MAKKIVEKFESTEINENNELNEVNENNEVNEISELAEQSEKPQDTKIPRFQQLDSLTAFIKFRTTKVDKNYFIAELGGTNKRILINYFGELDLINLLSPTANYFGKIKIYNQLDRWNNSIKMRFTLLNEPKKLDK